MSDAREAIRERGIKAIIALQAVAGITETRKQAEAGWDSMQAWEKKATSEAAKMLLEGQ